ncbi:MAG: hypothetical protein UY16_C0025G0002 [Candidatus Gottesmanbacteria bacterium GW2011_GWA2_47_9]|nr:MAG: hypothetical protein UY16_C0025G0002 [Candidatus Gottesmanbacteria bacterium GW2011_GWA2_47_9]
MKGKIVRIAHMGSVSREDIDKAVEAMVKARNELQ